MNHKETKPPLLPINVAIFVGLPLDDENQFELTDDYIAQWSQQILTEFGLA